MSTGTPTSAAASDADRRLSLRLRLVLLAVAAGCIAWFVYANSRTESYRLMFPAFEPWLWNLYLTTALAGLVGTAAMAWRRRWGFWTLVTSGVLASLIGLYAMGFTLIGVAVVLIIGAVWFAAEPEWDTFR